MRFKVGDIVRVLSMDEMVNDRDARILATDSSLSVPYPEDLSKPSLTFNTNMYRYCGEEYVINEITASGHEYCLKGIEGYVFNDNMVDAPEVVDFDVSKIDEFLRCISCDT